MNPRKKPCQTAEPLKKQQFNSITEHDHVHLLQQKCRDVCGTEPPAEKLLSKLGRWLRFGDKSSSAKKPYGLKLAQADRGGYLFVIKNHHTGESVKGWTGASQPGKELLTPAERAKLVVQRKQKERIRQQREQRRLRRLAVYAQRLWSRAAKPEDWEEPHPYIAKKQVNPLNVRRLRTHKRDVLLLPMIDLVAGSMASLYLIYPNGFKRPLKGSKTKGLCMAVSKVSIDGCDEVWLVEGYATALSLYQQVEEPVIVAFSASNLEPVTERLQQRYPHLKIKLCADDDRKTAQKIGRNPGIEAAQKIHKRWPQIALYKPVFPPGAPDGLSDVNDVVNFAREHGGLA